MYRYILEKINILTGEGNDNPLQYCCLGNPMDGGAWWAAVRGVEKSRTGLSDFTFTFHFHALEKQIATHSIILVWRIPGTGAWWAAVYGVAQSRTWLMWLSCSSSNILTVSTLAFHEDGASHHLFGSSLIFFKSSLLF